eukprot:TRINITY_DN26199_c0_g1_i1.p2 TRINITY_DN26199_c0_g1~~TRINITY_DN26199_c0_g1_i1.p2  ORF type:complete len:202 (+),score=-10.48 TRINITY_DN26199_c0_g1_i1:637-1242(+)
MPKNERFRFFGRFIEKNSRILTICGEGYQILYFFTRDVIKFFYLSWDFTQHLIFPWRIKAVILLKDFFWMGELIKLQTITLLFVIKLHCNHGVQYQQQQLRICYKLVTQGTYIMSSAKLQNAKEVGVRYIIRYTLQKIKIQIKIDQQKQCFIIKTIIEIALKLAFFAQLPNTCIFPKYYRIQSIRIILVLLRIFWYPNNNI